MPGTKPFSTDCAFSARIMVSIRGMLERGGERVLVVDDDPDFCDACAKVLEDAGYQVEVAGSVADGLAAMRERRPGLVILDLMMEQADSGFRFAEAVTRQFPGMPVLLLSSILDAAAQVIDMNRVPVSEFATKPMRSPALLEAVRRLLDQGRSSSSNEP
jgi:two-component system nitrogen regulation response regulator NtrX